MGKVRVKILGIEEVEEKQKEEARLASEAKRAKKRKEQKKTAKAPGLKGADERSEGARLPDRRGRERVVAVGPTEDELAKVEQVEKVVNVEKPISPKSPLRKKSRSKHYQKVAKMVDKTNPYSLKDALEFLSKIHLSKFDETVELHINTTTPKLSVGTTLPHGTGKKTKVAIADEKLIENVSKGEIDFDVLLATPTIMPKLAKVAKFLGPRGLMPNPKNGTISNNPQELVKKYQEGRVTLKTESKAAVMHVAVGKLSFGEKKLAENIQSVFSAIRQENIKNAILKSTMSPGIKILTQ